MNKEQQEKEDFILSLDIADFILTNKDNTRARDSKIKQALESGAPCYISQVNHGGAKYYKIYYKKENKIVSQLLKNTPLNTTRVITPLKENGAIIAQ